MNTNIKKIVTLSVILFWGILSNVAMAEATPQEQNSFFQDILGSITGTGGSAVGRVTDFFQSIKSEVYNEPSSDNNASQTNPNNISPLPPIPSTKNFPSITNQQPSQFKQSLTSWSEDLRGVLDSVYKDPSKIDNKQFTEMIRLNKQYENAAGRFLNQYMNENKDKMDELTEETQERAKTENGSDNSPFYIEPNQFRKVCDQNKYILYSRVGGASNRDMRNPVQTGGLPTGEQSVWRVPTCDQLAACHCCINTCTDVHMKKIPLPKGGYILVPVCLQNVGFAPMGCSPACKAPIARGACSGFSGPSHGDQGNRDCMGRKNGCENSGGCEIIIKDPNYTQFEYTTTPDSQVYVKSKPGDNSVPPGAKVKKLNNANSLPQGWIGQLDPAAGECCKCIQGQ